MPVPDRALERVRREQRVERQRRVRQLVDPYRPGLQPRQPGDLAETTGVGRVGRPVVEREVDRVDRQCLEGDVELARVVGEPRTLPRRADRRNPALHVQVHQRLVAERHRPLRRVRADLDRQRAAVQHGQVGHQLAYLEAVHERLHRRFVRLRLVRIGVQRCVMHIEDRRPEREPVGPRPVEVDAVQVPGEDRLPPP